MRQLSHTGTTVKEHRPICVACKLSHVLIEGAKCRSCIETADKFSSKRFMVKANKFIWMAIGTLVILSIADLFRRYK